MLRTLNLFFSFIATASFGPAAVAAEINFLSASATTPAIRDIIPLFQRETGHRVNAKYANIGTIVDRIRKGETVDVITVSPRQIAELTSEGKVAAGTHAIIAKVGLGMFVKSGAQKPAINSVEAFKSALLSAKSIAVTDPARGSPVGAYMLPLFDKLGVGADVKSKLLLAAGGGTTFEAVAKGGTEIGFSQVSEIIAAPGIELAGLLPPEIQNFTTFSAGILTSAKEPNAGKELIAFLASSKSAAAFKANGLEPSN